MNRIFLVLLSLSVSGSILAILLLALKPLIKDRFSNTWQYYIWLIIIMRFLLPITSEVNLVGSVAQYIESGITATDQISGQFVPKSEPETPTSDGETWPQTPQTDTDTMTPPEQNLGKIIQDNIWLVWATGMLMMFFYKVISYNAFVRFVKIRAEIVDDPSILDIYRAELASAKVKRRIPLKLNDRTGSPMLAGIIRPVLIIPSLEISEDNLRYIFRHELTHYKRRDIFYKWLIQFTKCLHWFNPFVYLIGRQIDQSCELSCDETIIRRLDKTGREGYGDALLASLKSQENYSAFVISMTMCDNKIRLKERLDAIMSFKRKSKFTIAISIVASCSLLSGAVATGAYAVESKEVTSPKPEQTSTEQNTKAFNSVAEITIDSRVIYEEGVYYIFCNGADESDKPSCGVTEGSIMFVLVRKDSYTTIGGFDNLERLVNEVTEQCSYMLEKQFISQDEAKLIVAVAAKIQSGDDSEFIDYKVETSYENEYALWGIERKDGAYYYNNERLRIFMDLRANNSFVHFNYDKLGTNDLRLLREQNGSIIKAEYLSQIEADEILADLDTTYSNTVTEDVRRLSKEMVPEKVLDMINSCDTGIWYNIVGNEYQYIYYNGVPHNYAWQPKIENGSASIDIFDLGKSTGTYVLLEVPANLQLTFSYNNKQIAYEKIDIQ